ncbi:MAG TPA: hypothetical protein DCE71_02305, partial [Parachlamydiales bacterium]|nr:hypothetical protein [Parachlamydiales bacterium]
DTPYKKYLAANLLHSTRPDEEKVLSFSSSKQKKKHPYNPSIHDHPFDPTQHKICKIKKINELSHFQVDLLYEPLAYNQRSVLDKK